MTVVVATAAVAGVLTCGTGFSGVGDHGHHGRQHDSQVAQGVPVREPPGEHIKANGGGGGGQRRALVPQSLDLAARNTKNNNNRFNNLKKFAEIN